ncbi:hypothetical protein KKF61_07155 [Patescibacteria group bacterium]|nr:hypothetical protein [Patescibacteria group bacterium]
MNPNISFGWNPTNVTGDVIAHSGKCIMHNITLNGVTTVGDILVYDGVDNTGTLIATLNIRTAVAVSFQGMTFNYDCKMATGIFLDFQTFAGNVTVTWG